MRISDWSADVCASDLHTGYSHGRVSPQRLRTRSRGMMLTTNTQINTPTSGANQLVVSHCTHSKKLRPSTRKFCMTLNDSSVTRPINQISNAELVAANMHVPRWRSMNQRLPGSSIAVAEEIGRAHI